LNTILDTVLTADATLITKPKRNNQNESVTYMQLTISENQFISCFESADTDMVNDLKKGVRIRLETWKTGIYTNGKNIEIYHAGTKTISKDPTTNTKEGIKSNSEFARIQDFMLEFAELIQKHFKK
jgi:hypothetical protein